MVQGQYLGRSFEEKTGLCLVLCPDRRDFLGLGSYLGSLNALNRQVLWKNGLALWTSFVRDSVHGLALEHPSTYLGRGDITLGLDMNAREKTGLLQHVVQHAMEILLHRYYQDTLPLDLATQRPLGVPPFPQPRCCFCPARFR